MKGSGFLATKKNGWSLFVMKTITESLKKENSTDVSKKQVDSTDVSTRIERARNSKYRSNRNRYSKKMRVYPGGIIEIWLYEDPIFINYDVGGRKMKDYISEEYEKNRHDTVVKAWRKIVNLGNSNFTTVDKFITLTFSPKEHDLTVANNKFNKFVMRLKYGYGDFKYLAIIELHLRGGVHYHMISTLPYIENRAPNRKLEKIWSNGTVTINKIKSVDNIGVYLTGYANCEKKKRHPRIQKGKTYLRSNNLVMASTLIGQEYEDKLQELKDNGKIAVDQEGNLKNIRHSGLYKRKRIVPKLSLDKREHSFVEYLQINPHNTYKEAPKIYIAEVFERL